jgi:hypothetical protein
MWHWWDMLFILIPILPINYNSTPQHFNSFIC